MPRPISEIGLADRPLPECVAQLGRSREELFGARHERAPNAVAVLRGTRLGRKLAHRAGDLKQLRSGVFAVL